jgi:hypothetical protein
MLSFSRWLIPGDCAKTDVAVSKAQALITIKLFMSFPP